MVDFDSFEGKLVLSEVRGCDHAHPGEFEAVDYVLMSALSRRHLGDCISATSHSCSAAPPRPVNVLDVGSGRGGSLAHVASSLGSQLGAAAGVDLDSRSVEYSNRKYGPQAHFFACNACDTAALRNAVGQILDLKGGSRFDLVYMLTSFYAMRDQDSVLRGVYDLCDNGAVLCIMDFSDPLNGPHLEGRWNPIRPKFITSELEEAGWKNVRIEDLTAKFEEWYRQLWGKIQSKKAQLVSRFGEKWYNGLVRVYGDDLLLQYQNGFIGGVLVTAIKA
ncbi:Demethylrebeccamycin-D-glucose O-methyltransferase [Pelomyxa schiedti]|nr:Demethylrebeccamycin-D-glucose O-methyltransferase [Pelomyxa schiedti]